MAKLSIIKTTTIMGSTNKMTKKVKEDEKVKSRGQITVKKFTKGQINFLSGNCNPTDEEILRALRNYRPVKTIKTSNTTTFEFDQHAVDCLDISQARIPRYWLALGNDDSIVPSETDSSLNNEVFRNDVTQPIDEGGAILFSTYVGTLEGNGYTFRECGIFTEEVDGLMLNHSLFGTQISKDSSFALVVDVKIEFTR